MEKRNREERAEKEFEGRVVVYDIEPDRNSDAADKKALPRRVRRFLNKNND